MFRAHVLIIRRSKLHYTASGIITTIYFDVLLTVYLSIFISVINQLDAQNFCFHFYIPIFLLRPFTIILNTMIQSIVARDIIPPDNLSHLCTKQSLKEQK